MVIMHVFNKKAVPMISSFFPLLNFIAVAQVFFLVDARILGANNTLTLQMSQTIDGEGPYTSVPIVDNVVSETFFATSTLSSTAPLNFISPELQNGITFDSMSLEKAGGLPPDPHGAAGPLSVVSVVNFRIQSLSKDGQSNWEVSLTKFFEKLEPTKMIFDPKVIYDVHASVFAVVALEGARECDAKVSNILLAVSKNSNPTDEGDWNFKKIRSFDDVQNSWADYPGFECDEDAYYITANMFKCVGGSFAGPKLWIVKKNDFENGQPQEFYLENISATQPAEVRNRSGAGKDIGTYLVGESFECQYCFTFIQIKNPTTSAELAYATVTLNLGTDNPRTAQQKGATQVIKTGDSRVLDAVWQDYSVWFVSTRQNNNKATAVWAQIDVSKWPTLAVIQSGIIDAPEQSTFFPSISVNENGIAAFGVSASGPNIYAGAFFTWRRPTDAKGTTRYIETARAGLGSYSQPYGNRWGDYTGISIDPTSEDCFWVYNEYAGENTCGDLCTQEYFGTWNTAWARFCVAALPSSKPSTPPSIKPRAPTSKKSTKKKTKKRANKKQRQGGAPSGRGQPFPKKKKATNDV